MIKPDFISMIEAEEIVKLCQKFEPKKIVEIGTGKGTTTQILENYQTGIRKKQKCINTILALMLEE